MNEILSVFGVNWKLLLIQIFNFGILLVVLFRFLYRPVLKMIDERKAFLDEGIRNAETAQEEMSRIGERRKQTEKESLIKSELLMKETKTRAEELEKEITMHANERGEKIVHEAKARALDEKEKIIHESREEIARLTVLGVEKLLAKK